MPPRLELALGFVAIVAWLVLQFGVQPDTGMIHVLLAAGVILIIRAIARGQPGTP